MSKKESRKFSFVIRDPYDLSKAGVGVALRPSDSPKKSKRMADSSSYSVSQPTAESVIKRIKLR